MARRKSADNPTVEEREKRPNDELHKAIDRIMSCPCDDLKTTLSNTLDTELALHSERKAQTVDHFIELLFQERKRRRKI